jgi:thiol:disulfide interchange protein
MKKLALIVSLILPLTAMKAQVIEPVHWKYATEKTSGQEYMLVFTASIDRTWHLYSQDLPKGGPIPTTFTFMESNDFQLVGKVEEITKPEVKFDPNFKFNVKMFSNEAVFKQSVRLTGQPPVVVRGSVEFMSCDDKNCLPPREEEFEFSIDSDATAGGSGTMTDKAAVQPVQPVVSLTQDTTTNISEPLTLDSGLGRKSLWGLFLLSFVLGLAGLLTPCVYPMIPMTVSFFMQGSEKRSKAVLKALVFGFSIVLIYTSLGLIVSLTSAGANFANVLSTHWIPNLIFFLLFMLFAASFLGMFELVLPSGLTNRADRKADKGGVIGAFFMALVTTLVSFSCTGPIIGALLVKAATGEVLEPLIGMFGFGLAFALPFTLLALSPSLVQNLPKSGGWLNVVKVFLGFVVLAFGLKFLSNIDQAYHLGILGRDLFLAIWIVIFTLLGFYLLGKIKFAHDSELPHLSIPRLVLVIAVFTFVVYLVPGLFGAPLKGISGLLPPATSSSFTLGAFLGSDQGNNGNSTSNAMAATCETPKYADILALPYGLTGYFDYEQGMACARKLHKPVFLDFKGHACSNCKEMEARVWSDPEVLRRLRNDFVIIALYSDDKTKLPEKEWIISTYDGKEKKTLGGKNGDLQITHFHTNTLPFYTIVDLSGKPLVKPVGFEPDREAYIKFLDTGKARFYGR